MTEAILGHRVGHGCGPARFERETRGVISFTQASSDSRRLYVRAARAGRDVGVSYGGVSKDREEAIAKVERASRLTAIPNRRHRLTPRRGRGIGADVGHRAEASGWTAV